MHGKPDLKAALLSAQLSWRRTRYGKTPADCNKTSRPPRTYTQKTKKPTENLPKHAKSPQKKRIVRGKTETKKTNKSCRTTFLEMSFLAGCCIMNLRSLRHWTQPSGWCRSDNCHSKNSVDKGPHQVTLVLDFNTLMTFHYSILII